MRPCPADPDVCAARSLVRWARCSRSPREPVVRRGRAAMSPATPRVTALQASRRCAHCPGRCCHPSRRQPRKPVVGWAMRTEGTMDSLGVNFKKCACRDANRESIRPDWKSSIAWHFSAKKPGLPSAFRRWQSSSHALLARGTAKRQDGTVERAQGRSATECVKDLSRHPVGASQARHTQGGLFSINLLSALRSNDPRPRILLTRLNGRTSLSLYRSRRSHLPSRLPVPFRPSLRPARMTRKRRSEEAAAPDLMLDACRRVASSLAKWVGPAVRGVRRMSTGALMHTPLA